MRAGADAVQGVNGHSNSPERQAHAEQSAASHTHGQAVGSTSNGPSTSSAAGEHHQRACSYGRSRLLHPERLSDWQIWSQLAPTPANVIGACV